MDAKGANGVEVKSGEECWQSGDEEWHCRRVLSMVWASMKEDE